MAKKQSSKKPSKKTAKAPKVDATAVTPTLPKARERDPRLPAAGTTVTRMYKGKEHRVTVLEQGFRYEGAEYRSLTAIARVATGYPAISGPAWFGIAEQRAATPKAAENAAAPAKRHATKVKRAGRDPAPETPTEAAPAAVATPA